jgi:hypothetical protein
MGGRGVCGIFHCFISIRPALSVHMPCIARSATPLPSTVSRLADFTTHSPVSSHSSHLCRRLSRRSSTALLIGAAGITDLSTLGPVVARIILCACTSGTGKAGAEVSIGSAAARLPYGPPKSTHTVPRPLEPCVAGYELELKLEPKSKSRPEARRVLPGDARAAACRK